MSKTFTDLNGNTHELDTEFFDICTSCNEDIVTGDITGYFVEVNNSKLKVDKNTYDAVKTYLENC